MKEEIKQLIDDLRITYRSAATRERCEEAINGGTPLESIFLNKSKSVAELMGLDIDLFPNEESLSVEEKHLITKELIRLMEYYHFEPMIPRRFPFNKLYPLLIKAIKDKYNFWITVDGKTADVCLCHNTPKECPFGQKYCECKYVEEDVNKFMESITFV
ncbi:MAG: hypothetical protein PHR20_05190 [Bacteroidales bacterium]|nr:hypothetical protein [Bacteroidales bacterium]